MFVIVRCAFQTGFSASVLDNVVFQSLQKHVEWIITLPNSFVKLVIYLYIFTSLNNFLLEMLIVDTWLQMSKNWFINRKSVTVDFGYLYLYAQQNPKHKQCAFSRYNRKYDVFIKNQLVFAEETVFALILQSTADNITRPFRNVIFVLFGCVKKEIPKTINQPGVDRNYNCCFWHVIEVVIEQ